MKTIEKVGISTKYCIYLLKTIFGAIIFEPTNRRATSTQTYLEGLPQTLPSYLDEFKCECSLIVVSHSMIECKSFLSDHSDCHKFLTVETNYKIKECSATHFEFCCEFKSTDNTKVLSCLGCHIVDNFSWVST